MRSLDSPNLYTTIFGASEVFDNRTIAELESLLETVADTVSGVPVVSGRCSGSCCSCSGGIVGRHGGVLLLLLRLVDDIDG